MEIKKLAICFRLRIPEVSGHRFRCKVGHLFRSKLGQSFRCKLGQ